MLETRSFSYRFVIILIFVVMDKEDMLLHFSACVCYELAAQLTRVQIPAGTT